MPSFFPIAFTVPQYEDNDGKPASGAVLKAYAASTSTPISMATDYTGGTTVATITLNAAGYPTVSGNVVIPHADQNIKLALYPDAAAAASDTGEIWMVDNIPITVNADADPFFQSLTADGSQVEFTLSHDLGTDEKAILLYTSTSNLNPHQVNGDFATDTVWTKGAGWTIGSGVATAAGAISTAIQQNSAKTLIPGKSYNVTYTITRSAGTLAPSVGGTAGTARNADGTYTEQIIAGSTQVLAFTGAGFTGTLDNVKVTEVTDVPPKIIAPTDFTLNGTTLTFLTAPAAGSIQIWAPTLLVGAASSYAASASISAASALASKNAAATSETNAANSEDAAELAEDNAENSADDAADSAEEARIWAVGTILEQAAGSAKYWAQQAFNAITGAVKVSTNDTTAGVLNGKLVAGKKIKFTENNDGGNETLTIDGLSRITAITSSATPAPNSDTTDQYNVTALATNATFAAPTGTPTDGQELKIRIKDNGTARTLVFNSGSGGYRAGTDIPLPTTTVLSKTMYLGFLYNAADNKWDFVATLGGF